jgi:hypothetical protein
MTLTPFPFFRQALGFQFTRADKNGVRQLVVRDGQHDYLFDEVG